MFDAFLAIYRSRTRDLLRIATGGTGVLPLGNIHPDLVERLAQEASKTARHLLLMCIRAIDYCPPVDVTYGDYMRALITADVDLVPEDDRNYRVAIIEAFRAWGIYPEEVRTLSVESLRLKPPPADKSFQEFVALLRPAFLYDENSAIWREIVNGRAPNEGHAADRPFRKYTRMEVAGRVADFSARLHKQIKDNAFALVNYGRLDVERDRPFGLNLGYGHEDDYKFEVHQVRPVRRQAPDGRMIQDLLIQITQRRPGYLDENEQRKENERYRVVGQTIPTETWRLQLPRWRDADPRPRDLRGTLRHLQGHGRYQATRRPARLHDPFESASRCVSFTSEQPTPANGWRPCTRSPTDDWIGERHANEEAQD